MVCTFTVIPSQIQNGKQYPEERLLTFYFVLLLFLTLRGPYPGVGRCCRRRREVHRGKGEGEGGRRGAAAVSRGGGPVGGVGREEAHASAQGWTASTVTKCTKFDKNPLPD